MKKARKALPLKTIAVEHPVHGTYIADNVKDKLQAVQRAAKVWKVQWSVLAKECEFSLQSCEAPTIKGQTAGELKGGKDDASLDRS